MPGAQTRERSAVFVEVEVADGTVGVGETYLGCLHAGAGD
jgi:L-alanine-DL-glutamate epimerase-like enolase superfamily enzyme